MLASPIRDGRRLVGQVESGCIGGVADHFITAALPRSHRPVTHPFYGVESNIESGGIADDYYYDEDEEDEEGEFDDFGVEDYYDGLEFGKLLLFLVVVTGVGRVVDECDGGGNPAELPASRESRGRTRFVGGSLCTDTHTARSLVAAATIHLSYPLLTPVHQLSSLPLSPS